MSLLVVEKTDDGFSETFISDVVLAILLNNIKLIEFIRKNVVEKIVPDLYN